MREVSQRVSEAEINRGVRAVGYKEGMLSGKAEARLEVELSVGGARPSRRGLEHQQGWLYG